MDVVKGGAPADLRELSLELSAWMFYLGERTRSVDEGRHLAETTIATGQAREKFRQGIRLQGGDDRVVDEPRRLPNRALAWMFLVPRLAISPARTASSSGLRSPFLAVAARKKKTPSTIPWG